VPIAYCGDRVQGTAGGESPCARRFLLLLSPHSHHRWVCVLIVPLDERAQAREDNSLWQLLTTSTATPMLEFDFVGSDWLQVVAMVGESQERLERLKQDPAEREKRIAKYASQVPSFCPSPAYCTPSMLQNHMSPRVVHDSHSWTRAPPSSKPLIWLRASVYLFRRH
jgi:hypothetical protein